jgi:hypothetical protein
VTAKCLSALQTLFDALTTRARLYRQLAATFEKLAGSQGDGPSARWRLAITLTRLSGELEQMAAVAICADDFIEAAREIASKVARLRLIDDTGSVLTDAVVKMVELIKKIGAENEASVADASQVVEHLLPQLTAETATQEGRSRLRQHRLWLPERPLHDSYWASVTSASEKASDILRQALEQLRMTVKHCSGLLSRGTEISATDLVATLTRLAERNEAVADMMRQPLLPVASWAHRILDREIVHASSGNETDFDASELISAIAIVERWEEMPEIEIRYAIQQSLRGERRDGSWSTSQPIYLRDDALGVWPGTIDIVWSLASTISARPRIAVADQALGRYLQWLQRTMAKAVTPKGTCHTGWSDAVRSDNTVVEVWTTASAINSLLAVRDILEYRLWELCERRFRVEPAARSLDQVDPVDLGAVHGFRLHARLLDAARGSARGDEDAVYSLILHGPPGSSKTALTTAFARECWPAAPHAKRLIRITPADFSIHGEDRLDAEARFIFRLLSYARGATILFDEIDDLLRLRQTGASLAFIELVVPAMLNRLQDLRDAAPRQELCFLLATNYIERIEPAMTRRGRVDVLLTVPYPDALSRELIIRRVFDADPPHLELLVEGMAGWAWGSIVSFCKVGKGQAGFTRLSTDEVRQQLRDFEVDRTPYYHSPERWERECLPLCDEFIRHTFAKSGESSEQQVEHIVNRMPSKSLAGPLLRVLERVRIRERRSLR